MKRLSFLIAGILLFSVPVFGAISKPTIELSNLYGSVAVHVTTSSGKPMPYAGVFLYDKVFGVLKQIAVLTTNSNGDVKFNKVKIGGHYALALVVEMTGGTDYVCSDVKNFLVSSGKTTSINLSCIHAGNTNTQQSAAILAQSLAQRKLIDNTMKKP